MIYEENIKLYEKRYKTKYNPLLEDDDTVVSKDISQNGQTVFSILFEDRYWFLSSKYDSEIVAKGWTDLCEVDNDFSTIFIFGFANGDYIKEISKKHPNNIIIVYEPSINIFYNNMKNIDLSFILNNENITILVGHEQFLILEQRIFFILNYSNYSLSKMLTLPNYNRIFNLEQLQWIKLIERKKQNIIINGITEKWFERNIAENIVVNTIDLLNQNIVSNLIKRFRCQDGILNRPAIVVSAGPSLDDNVKELKKAQNKALIICVDSAILTVIKAGIKPDIIVTIDPNKPVRLFDIPEIIDIPLICDIEYNHKILDVYNGKRIYSFVNNQYIYELLKEQLPEIAMYDNTLISGGSVANSAFSLAIRLGFKDIILIGQDLAYPDNKTHSKDTKIDKDTIVKKGTRYFEVEDIFGSKVLTETNMNQYKEWFEEQIRLYKYINVYDATEGGAKINGTQIISLEEIIKEKCESLEEISFNDVINGIEPLFSKEVSKQLLDKFLDTQNLLSDIRNRIRKIIRIYENLNKLNISRKQGTKQFAKLLNELKEEQDKLENSAEIKLIEKFNVVELNDIQFSMYKQQENEYENFKFIFEKGIKYISIVYDNPQIYTYHYSVANKCNRIFLFDYSMYKELYDGGLRTVFYMPLPVNVDRYDDLIRKNDKRKCEEVSFVGSMYNEKHNLFDRMSKELVKTSPGTLGYLEGIMQAQSLVDGYWMIEDLLSDDIVNEMKKAYNYVTPTYYVTNDKYVYANYFLARKTTQITRTRILNKIANRFKLSLYTTNNTKEIVPNAIFKGNVEYYDEMPLVFHYSKININLTLKSIKTGIPLRVLDIMAAGGFVITNYQEDLFRHFTPDEDFVFYQDENDLINKIQYYLEHEEERKQIAQNGYRKVREICSYKNVIKNIIE